MQVGKWPPQREPALITGLTHASARWGKDAILAKFDLEIAYRMVPVHPQDRLYTARDALGGRYVCGRSSFVRSPLGSKALHGCGGCDAINHAQTWCAQCHAILELFLGPPRGEEC